MPTSEIRRRTPAVAHVTALLLAAIAIPALGWFIGGWTGATTLVVYWAETVLICLFAWGRIRVHQRWNPRRGHFRYQGPGATPGAQTGRSPPASPSWPLRSAVRTPSSSCDPLVAHQERLRIDRGDRLARGGHRAD